MARSLPCGRTTAQAPGHGSGGDRRALDQACGNLVAEDRVRDHHGIKVGADLDDLVAVEAADPAVMVRELRAFVSRGDGVKFGDCGVSINEQAFDLEPDSPRTLAVCRVPGALRTEMRDARGDCGGFPT